MVLGSGHGIGKLGGAVLVTLVERRSRLSLIALAPNKTAEAVKAAILKVLQPLSAQVHTLTYPIFVTLSHTPLCINGLFSKNRRVALQGDHFVKTGLSG